MVELLGVRLGGLPGPAGDVDWRRHVLEVKRGMEPREVAEDAAGGDDEEIAALLHDALVEVLRDPLKLAEELLEEERVRGLVVVPSCGKGGDLDPQVVPDGARSLHQALEHELALARHVPPVLRVAPRLLHEVHDRPNLLLEVAQVLLQGGDSGFRRESGPPWRSRGGWPAASPPSRGRRCGPGAPCAWS